MESHSKETFPKDVPHSNKNISAFFNNVTYVSPKVPTLYSVMSTGEDAANAAVYGEFSHPFVLDHQQIVEIVVNNHGEHSQVSHRHPVLMIS